MPVLYSSADDVRRAAAISLGFGQGIDTPEGGRGIGTVVSDGTKRPVRDILGSPVPAMPGASAVQAAQDKLSSILQSVMAQEAERDA